MANELPNLGAEIVLEFQQSINNIRLLGEAMEVLDSRFGNIERRIESLRSSLGALSDQVSRGSGSNLRREIERELNNLIDSNGIVISRVGTSPFRVDANTVRNLMQRIEREINLVLADSYRNIVLDINPDLNVGRIPIDKTDLDEVNKAIARLVKVQLNNFVAALRKHGADVISPQDLASLQFYIGKSTVQQIIGRIKQHITKKLLNPVVDSSAVFQISDRDLSRVFTAIREKVNGAIQRAVTDIGADTETQSLAPNIARLQEAVNDVAREYIRNVTQEINQISSTVFTRPLNDLSTQLRRHMARELGTDLETFNRMFANYRFSNQEVYSAELRRQFSLLERALNNKIGGELSEEVRRIVRAIDRVEISYSPKLHQYLVREIEKINNQIIKKIREQIDLQFAHMRAEIESVRVSPKDINRARRVREMGRVRYDDEGTTTTRPERRPVILANDPYARRDEYFNTFGLRGAIINTIRHILAGTIVGTPIMLLYQSLEQYRTSQLEQLKMFANLFAKAQADYQDRSEQGDRRTAAEVAQQTIQSIMPFVREASVAYAMDYGTVSAIASVGSRLLDDAASVKLFTDIVGKIYSIDREGDPVEGIASGLEAFMGQFDLTVGELERRVVVPLAVATNLTNATTEAIMNAIMRSGSSFKAAGISPEDAIAMVATSIQYTGLSGENIGNFFKSILPRLQSKNALRQLEEVLGINVYTVDENGVERARSAMEIMKDVAAIYPQLQDRNARDLVMALFGTYQSAKGMTTLDEFFKAVEISQAIQDFRLEDLDSMLANNLTSPIMEMERASTSVTLALTSLMEEMTPLIVDVSRGLTNLANGLRENSDEISGLIQFLGNALVGFATVYGFRRLYNTQHFQSAIGRIETIDALLGYRGIAGRGAKQGTLQALSDLPTVNANILRDDRYNRLLFGRALQDPVLSPVIKELSQMNDERMRELRNYIQDNNIVVRDMKDLVLAFEESRGYRARPELTDDQRWGGSQYAASRLYTKGMLGIDKDFVETLVSEFRDREKFDRLSQTERGMKVTRFLAGLDENELSRFRQHLEELHKQTGVAVKDFDSLANAVDSYIEAQQRSREEMRKTNPQLVALTTSADRLTASLNNNKLREGMRNFDAFVGGLSTKVRGAASAIAGLARSLAGIGAQMLAFAWVGDVITSLGSQGLYTEAQIENKKIEKLMQDLNELKSYTRMSSGRLLGAMSFDALQAIWDLVVPSDKYTDSEDIARMAEDFIQWLNETRGANLSTSLGPLPLVESISRYVKENNLNLDELFDEFARDTGLIQRQQESRAKMYRENYEKMVLEREELRRIEEQLNQEEAKRLREQRLAGQYRVLDLESLRKDLEDQANKINAEATLRQLRLLTEGYSSDSEEYIRIRKESTEQIISLYEDELTRIADFIRTARDTLNMMLREGGYSEEDIREQENLIAQWERNQKEAEIEFETRIRQLQLEEAQAEFDARLSRINRAAQRAESALALQEAVLNQTADRASREYFASLESISRERINNLRAQIAQLESAAITEDQQQDVDAQIAQLRLAIEQEKVRIRELQLSSITAYRQELQDALAQMSVDYLQARVAAGGIDENSPYLRNLRIEQYQRQVGMFGSIIADLTDRLKTETDPEAVKNIQREIRDLTRQSLQAQLGILEEMRNTGGTFNLPDNVKAMSYYEYITRNNTHTTYTVQGGDTHITITLPNITDGTSIERIRQIGRAIGEGIREGRSLRLQKQANPFGYRG